MSSTVDPSSISADADAQRRSEALTERIYVTFTALAVTIAFERDATHASVTGAALTLLLTVLGTVLTVFVADVVAHMVRESTLPIPAAAAQMPLPYGGPTGEVDFGDTAVEGATSA